MELSVPATLRAVPLSASLVSIRFAFDCVLSHRTKCHRRRSCVSKPLRLTLSLDRVSSVHAHGNVASGADDVDLWSDPESVEVIGIGSRKDAVLDFCLDSPFRSANLRFWNIIKKDSLKVLLQQRVLRKDIAPRVEEAPLSLQSCFKAIILVASAAYGLDHVAAIDILRTIRAANGLAVGLILKPFSFEGLRRQHEVELLVEKLQEHTNLCIVIDMDMLLQNDLVTLDEALRTANNAVLLAINAMSVLISEKYKKLIALPPNNMKELKFPEILKIMESYKEAKVGFGVGDNIKASILQAIYDCPFLSLGAKDSNGMVICVLASSGIIDSHDLSDFLQTFHQSTECTREIIVSTIREPDLEPNLIITTVIILGFTGQQAFQNSGGIFSRLAQHFPFVFNLLRRYNNESKKMEEKLSLQNSVSSRKNTSPGSGEVTDKISADGRAEGFDKYSKKVEELLSCNYEEFHDFSDHNNGFEQSGDGFSEDESESSNINDQNTEEALAFQREPLVHWNMGPGHQMAQEWAKEMAANSGSVPVSENLRIYRFPIGVKPSEESKDSSKIPKTPEHPKQISGDDMKTQSVVTPNMSSWDALTDISLEAVLDFYNSASTLVKKKNADVPKKQGVLSVRAASMLEAERDSQKKWSPIVEMEYQRGVYRGRLQGGLPEGKGRLLLEGGSIYDGMWHYGKRSGLGSFYFSNGDVFQGSWRDDFMHGKGWFYFHSGDRWFANFWKGKANGEGRFYSKSGDVLFGHFRDGWRQGQFLCINVDGARFIEIWDEGVLVSRSKLDPGSGHCDSNDGG